MSLRAVVQASRRKPLVTLIIILAIGIPIAAFANDVFTDVPTTASFHEAANAIARAGITTGCATGLYCPSANVTRAQMALFMHRGFGRVGKSVVTGVIDPANPSGSMGQISMTPGMPAITIGASAFVTANSHLGILVVDSAGCPCVVGAVWQDETQGNSLGDYYNVVEIPAGSDGKIFSLGPTGASQMANIVVGGEAIPHVYSIGVNQDFGPPYGLGSFEFFGDAQVEYSPFGNTGTNTFGPQTAVPVTGSLARFRTPGN